MDHIENAVSLQPRTGNAFIGMPLVRQRVGWILGDGSVYLYGFDGLFIVCGRVSFASAIEFLAFDFQFFEGQAV